MMESITSKTEIRAQIPFLLGQYQAGGVAALTAAVHSRLLRYKIRFPLLEYAAAEIAALLPEADQLPFTDSLATLDTIGGNTIAGMMLQLRLARHFESSLEKAAAYIIRGQSMVCMRYYRGAGYGLCFTN